jgi:hypothetical protein
LKFNWWFASNLHSEVKTRGAGRAAGAASPLPLVPPRDFSFPNFCCLLSPSLPCFGTRPVSKSPVKATELTNSVVFLIRKTREVIRSVVFLVRKMTAVIRSVVFLVRKMTAVIRSVIFLVRKTREVIRSVVFLVRKMTAVIRSVVFLVRKMREVIRSVVFLVRKMREFLRKITHFIVSARKVRLWAGQAAAAGGSGRKSGSVLV